MDEVYLTVLFSLVILSFSVSYINKSASKFNSFISLAIYTMISYASRRNKFSDSYINLWKLYWVIANGVIEKAYKHVPLVT